MIKAILLLFLIAGGGVYAQEPQLVAEKGKQRLLFSNGQAVRLHYRTGNSVLMRKGHLYCIPDHIELHAFQKKDTSVLRIAPGRIAGVRRVRRTGKLIAGLAGLGMLCLGMSAIVEDQRERGELLDGLGTLAGLTGIVVDAVPYTVIALADRSTATLDGYRYAIVRAR